ncbi:hypothetical protein OH77DRAFT_543910 [Trametes cingulata]|nr:hypothetical protein OH77DRAFT_543910 [Trametes cingulata]
MEPMSMSRQARPEGPIRTNSSGRGPGYEERAGSSSPYPQLSASGVKASASVHRGTRYKDKFLALREKYETVTATHDEYERKLARADEKLKRLQEECNLLLDAVDIAVPAQPTLLHYLTQDPIAPQYYSRAVPVPTGLPPEATIPQHLPASAVPQPPPAAAAHPHPHQHARAPSPPPPMHMQPHAHAHAHPHPHAHPLSRSHSHVQPPPAPHQHVHAPPPPPQQLQPIHGMVVEQVGPPKPATGRGRERWELTCCGAVTLVLFLLCVL